LFTGFGVGERDAMGVATGVAETVAPGDGVAVGFGLAASRRQSQSSKTAMAAQVNRATIVNGHAVDLVRVRE